MADSSAQSEEMESPHEIERDASFRQKRKLERKHR